MTDPTAVLHSHLASALSTLGDAQYWEESISPAEIRRSLQDADPSSPSSVPALLKAMKWLLASISKGRDVSDFYVQVVKLVSCLHSLEVRKMVYIYLVQYADHSPETRELSLLSINSFQRGLRDSEPWIRALALRVLTSVTLPDILAIQVLAVTQHAANDTSPYVRKCAAMAVSKLYPRCREPEQRAVLLELLQQLLDVVGNYCVFRID
jgi:AP-3 complex subunit beta